MIKFRLKNTQKAQGMVEFALVLPILLLVILGVIAFGHLFFVYSSVVSASREAARWGSAVGEAPSSAPRYQDCTSIRASAVRVGSFAGVSPNTVVINYDHGPVNPPNAPVVFANCPLAGTGPNSSQVNRGDRIVVRVTVQYTPIVPFVNLPSFPLTAETGRTIVKNLPVGEAPVAEDPCVTETNILITPNPTSSVTGQQVTFGIQVTAVDGTTPTGSVSYSDTDGNAPPDATLTNGRASFNVAFQSAGDKIISVRYTPDAGNTCHMGKAVPDYVYTVNKASTTLEVKDFVDPSGRGNILYLTAWLTVTPPGASTSAGPVGGQVNFVMSSGGSHVSCSGTLDGALTATCPVTPNQDGVWTITATYPGDSNFNGSNDTEPHTVVPPTTATFIPTPTRFAPTGTSTPPFCPYFETDVLSLSSPPTSFTIDVRNRDMYDMKISKVTVSWPTSGATAKLKEIRFSDASGVNNACANNNHAQCIWWANNNNQALLNGNPLNVTSGSGGNWSNNNPGIARNASRRLRLLFTTDLASTGRYFLEVEFVDSQGRRCTTSPAIEYTR